MAAEKCSAAEFFSRKNPAYNIDHQILFIYRIGRTGRHAIQREVSLRFHSKLKKLKLPSEFLPAFRSDLRTNPRKLVACASPEL